MTRVGVVGLGFMGSRWALRCSRGVDDPLRDAVEATEAVRISLAMEEAAETGEVVRVE